MSGRLGVGLRWTGVMFTRLRNAIAAEIGLHEVLLIGSLTLVTVALWPIAEQVLHDGRVSLLVPGLVGMWITMPTRTPFVHRPLAPPEKRRSE